MIKVKIYRHGDKISGFSINGHSGKAPRGEDIYCAGISTVSQAAYMCITDHLNREVAGNVYDDVLELRLLDEPDEVTEAVFQTMLIGITEIQRLVPDAVKIINIG